MKFKKEVQGIILVLTTTAFILLAITIESEWTKEYLIFAGINLLVLVVGGILLNKYGRFEE